MSDITTHVPAAGALAICTDYGTLTVNGVELVDTEGAWTIPDMSEMWKMPEQRGSDRLVPGVNGVRSYPRRNAPTTYQLGLTVVGSVNEIGVSYADPAVGLQQNWETLEADVFRVVSTGDGTRTCVWTKPNGDTISKSAHVRCTGPAALPGYVIRTSLQLEVPSGGFY